MTYIRLFAIFIWATCYFIAGIPLIPFKAAGKFYRWSSGYFGKHLLFLLGGKASWEGFENIDPSQSYVFVGNHQSYADIFLVQLALLSKGMRTVFMVKEELFRFPFFETMSNQMGLIPVARGESKKGMQAMIEGIRTAKEGLCITIFPEGTRTSTGELSPFKRGAFVLAEKSGKTIVPFVITGTRYIFPKEKLKVTPGQCHVKFMKPITTDEIQERKLSSKELTVEVEKIVADEYKNQLVIMDKIWNKTEELN